MSAPVDALGRWTRRARALAWAAEAALVRARDGRRVRRWGWVTAHTLEPDAPRESLGHLGGALDMRVSRNALWMRANDRTTWHEIYDVRRRYDVVVFFKAMDARCQEEARRIQGYGGKVVFDANVNYYEVWGEYDVPDTRPTPEQTGAAEAMTRLADHVVADSSYLLEVVKRINPRATWIPDNVDLRVFRGRRRHDPGSTVRLVWSGVSKKAQHLLSVRDALSTLRGARLVVVSDAPPPCLGELRGAIACEYVRWSEAGYARTLLDCDVIISPKRLVNAYEMGHTEYKITCGMAVGLPAVASPQPSYLEAIGHAGGGLIAGNVDEWRAALERLVADAALRSDLGARAGRTVAERYATEVVAPRFLEVLGGLR